MTTHATGPTPDHAPGRPGWEDGWWFSADGLRLHYRDYPGRADRAPVLCVPGLTRNARDFAGLASRLAGGRRVIVVELRGRGGSAWAADPWSYVPPVYAADVVTLIDRLGLPPLVWIGTSLGGIVGMLAALTRPERFAGLLLNDIGPVIEAAGLARIAAYVGEARWPGWQACAEAQAAVHADAHPDFTEADWLAMARRLCREEAGGGIVPDYDPAIAIPFAAPPPPPADPWALVAGLGDLPGLIVRGATSDILSEATAAGMTRRLGGFERITVAGTGHAPTLDEPAVAPALARLLAKADAFR